MLNRIICWEGEGIRYEVDQRHSEVIIKEMCLDDKSKGVVSPGTKEILIDVNKAKSNKVNQNNDEGRYCEDDDLSDKESTRYRALAARLNFLALDRFDLQFTAKEVAKCVHHPISEVFNQFKRLVRFLVDHSSLIQMFKWQGHKGEAVSVYTDSDWAGDSNSGKSTSGGCILIASQVITKGVAQSIGIISLGVDFGDNLKSIVSCDASAAIGIVHRQGLGKLRHANVQFLWIQDNVKANRLKFHKIPGTDNQIRN